MLGYVLLGMAAGFVAFFLSLAFLFSFIPSLLLCSSVVSLTTILVPAFVEWSRARSKRVRVARRTLKIIDAEAKHV